MGWVVMPRHDRLPPKKETRYPLYRRLSWSSGPVWTGAENLAPTGIRSPDRPARSESLYRLSYPGYTARAFLNKTTAWSQQRMKSRTRLLLVCNTMLLGKQFQTFRRKMFTVILRCLKSTVAAHRPQALDTYRQHDSPKRRKPLLRYTYHIQKTETSVTLLKSIFDKLL